MVKAKVAVVISILLICLSGKGSTDLNTWQRDLVTKNAKLLQRISWEDISKLDQRTNSQTVAVIGSGISVEYFKDFFLVNNNEIPDNLIDDDNNGYVDDYYGYNFHKKNGDIDTVSSGHESGIASLIAMLASFNINKEYPLNILPLKISTSLAKSDPMFLKKIADAIDYAVARGVRVISVSQGISELYSRFFRFQDNDYIKSLKYIQDAIDRAENAGAVVFASPSNDRNRNHDKEKQYIANMNSVISVAYCDFSRKVRSGYGNSVTTAFWGKGIYVFEGTQKTFPIFENKIGGMNKVSGTSYATPMLATIVALGLAQNEELGPTEIREQILRASTIRIRGKRQVESRRIFSPVAFLQAL